MGMPDDTADLTPPACGPTLARLQAALDGDGPLDPLDADPHALGCPVCRERIRAARVLLAALAAPTVPATLPPAFTNSILAAVRADRRARSRRQVFALAGGLAAAAAVLVAVFALTRGKPDAPESAQRPPAPVVVPNPEPAPAPAPEPRPVRLGDELAKAGEALRGTSKPITDPAAAAPKVLATLAGGWLTAPAVPAPTLKDAGKSLADIRSAAADGLEPVTGSVTKAFARLKKDVESVQPPAQP